MTMTMKAIKAKMEYLFNLWCERNDPSYMEFYNSLRTLRALDMMTDEEFKKIYEYDRDLFARIG